MSLGSLSKRWYNGLVQPVSRLFRSERVPVPGGIPPFELAARLDPAVPVDLEIGCGVGWHPIAYAKANPDRFLVAIERTREKFARFSGRIARHGGISNLLPVHADAVNWITHCLPPVQIERCMVFYPNPCPGRPSQRWIRMPFLDRLMSSLSPGGEIRIVTNLDWYFEEIKTWAPKRGLRVLAERIFGGEEAGDCQPRTHFEKKYLMRGESCFEVSLVRNGELRSPPLW